MLKTCSLPPAERLKILTCPDSTMKSPARGSPSANTISPAENGRGTVRCAKKDSSASLSPEKMGIRVKVSLRLVLGSGTPTILADTERTRDSGDEEPDHLSSRGDGGSELAVECNS